MNRYATIALGSLVLSCLASFLSANAEVAREAQMRVANKNLLFISVRFLV